MWSSGNMGARTHLEHRRAIDLSLHKNQQEDTFEEDPFGHYQMGFDDGPSSTKHVSEGQQLAVAADQGTAPEQTSEATAEGAHASHTLQRVAHLVWRSTCGRHAAVRLGTSLRGDCFGEAIGAHPMRIRRLRARMHQTTDRLVYEPLD